MRKPLPESIRVGFYQIVNHPWQIGPVGLEITTLAWWACLTNQDAVQHQLTDIFSQKRFQPSCYRKIGVISGQIRQSRFARTEFKRRCPPLAFFLVNFGVKIVISIGDFIKALYYAKRIYHYHYEQNRHIFQSLSHVKRDCKYHQVAVAVDVAPLVEGGHQPDAGLDGYNCLEPFDFTRSHDASRLFLPSPRR